jgi:hypothetical protein
MANLFLRTPQKRDLGLAIPSFCEANSITRKHLSWPINYEVKIRGVQKETRFLME